MKDDKTWYLAGVLFIVAAIVAFAGDSGVAPVLLLVAGAAMLSVPSYNAKRRK